MDRRHVVGARVDALGGERRRDLVAGEAELGGADTHGEVLERRAVLRADALKGDARQRAQQVAVDGGQGVAPRGLVVEPRKALEAEQRARFGEARVETDEERVVGARIAVFATDDDALGERVVVGRHNAALAGDQELGRRGAEHLGQALAADRRAVAQGAEAVGRVVDDRQVAA